MSERGSTAYGAEHVWELAAEIAVTPEESQEILWRGSGRVVRGTKLQWLFLGIGTVGAMAGFAVLGGLTSVPPQYGLVMLAIGITVVAAVGVQLLSVRSFRSLTLSGRTVLFVLWVVAILGVWAGVAISLTLSVVSFFESGWEALALSFIGLSLMWSFLASEATPPLLTTAPAPRAYQARAAQFAWAGTVAAAILSVALVIAAAQWRGAQDGGALDGTLDLQLTSDHVARLTLLVMVLTTLLSALIVWYRSNHRRLEQQRRELLTALIELRAALAEFPPGLRDGRGPESLVLALRRVEILVAPSPFRTQAPAALPQPAAYEIVEMIRVLGNVVEGNNELPKSVAARAQHPGALSRPFRRFEELDRASRVERFGPFLDRCYSRLLTGKDPHRPRSA